MSNFSKYFNPNEIKNSIELVSRIVDDIVIANSKLLELNNKDSLTGQETIDLMNFNHQLNNYLREIEEMGCFLREITHEVFLVDFPTRINGKDVFVSWMSDEFSVKYYRNIDEDYNVRKIIPKEYFEQN